jgi:hypothetical protein
MPSPAPTQSGSIANAVPAHQFVNHWRALLTSGNDQFGGITWSIDSLNLVYLHHCEVLKTHVGIADPSPFKRCAAIAVAFMDERIYPIYSEFNEHKYKTELDGIPRYSGAVLLFEYIRYCLDGAVLNLTTGPVSLTEAITVSEHTYIDIVHALANLRNNGEAAFHMTALLFEQLVYLNNDVGYKPRF